MPDSDTIFGSHSVEVESAIRVAQSGVGTDGCPRRGIVSVGAVWDEDGGNTTGSIEASVGGSEGLERLQIEPRDDRTVAIRLLTLAFPSRGDG